ncbi:MAG: hypothetical protein ACLQFW_01520 [Xanthobacteraceae bacterium]
MNKAGHFGLAASAGRFIFGLMPSAWKIIAYRRPDKIGEPSIREFFLVALPEKDAAIAVLRMREGYDDAELEVIGEAPAESVDWLDIKPGQIFCIWSVQ